MAAQPGESKGGCAGVEVAFRLGPWPEQRGPPPDGREVFCVEPRAVPSAPNSRLSQTRRQQNLVERWVGPSSRLNTPALLAYAQVDRGRWPAACAAGLVVPLQMQVQQMQP